MSKIVFFCIPAHGHTNPTLGVVRELVNRGHQVWYYSFQQFREKIEAAGATFVSCDNDGVTGEIEQKDVANSNNDLAFFTKIMVDLTLALDEMVCRDMEKLKPDCIVADSMAIWGKAVALKFEIPFVSSTTTFAFNSSSAKIMKQSFREMLSMIFSMPKVQKEIKRLQDYGYPIHNVMDILQNSDDTDTVVYTSPEFQPCADSFSAHYAFVGPSVRPAVSQITKEREKLVYISMGTVNNDLLQFYKNCVQALAHTSYQVIMSVGDLVETESLGKLPENISVFHHVDQIAVLNQADVFLSHCGMNSVNESLYYQVPLVMYPQTTEQGGVAARVAQLGAGIRLMKNTPSRILEAVEEVLKVPSYRENAMKISEGFKKCGGAKTAADKILSVCRSGK